MIALDHEIIEKMQNDHEKELTEAQENFNIGSYYDFHEFILILSIDCSIYHGLNYNIKFHYQMETEKMKMDHNSKLILSYLPGVRQLHH